jgi:hypothetical protein
VRNLIWATALLVILCCSAEIVAQREGFGHPVLYRAASSGYEPVPNQHLVRLGHAITVNNLGTRGADAALLPAPHVWRIMVLGDSVTNGGSQLSDAETFPAIASRRLAERCRNEILNASAGGWSLFDEVAWIRSHGVFGARTIVWTINYMDLDQPPSSSATLDRNPSFPTRPPLTGLGEIMHRYILPRLGLGPHTADNGSEMGGDFNADQFTKVRALVRSEKRELDRRGISLIVLYHDGSQPMPPVRAAAELKFLTDLRDQGVAVVRTPLGAAPDRAQLYLDGIHPTIKGAARIGGSLADALRRQCATAIN